MVESSVVKFTVEKHHIGFTRNSRPSRGCGNPGTVKGLWIPDIARKLAIRERRNKGFS